MGKIPNILLSTLIIVSAFLTSCVQIQPQLEYQAVSWQALEEFSIPFQPDRCLYSPLSQTYIIQKGNYIHLYRKGKEINRIGGLGYGKDNFNKISDLKLAPDGNLLILDSFAKKISKFDLEGKWLTEFSLTGFSNPTLFAMSSGETFYIYDQNRNEIFIVKDFNQTPDESFARFELENPISLQLTKNYIVTYDNAQDKTFFYDLFGSFYKEEAGLLLEEHGRFFELQDYFFEELSTKKKFVISPYIWKGFQQRNGYWLLWSDQKIHLGKINYEAKP